MKKESFETDIFWTSASRYTKSILMQILSDWWWVPLLLIIGCSIMAIYINIAFIYVSLILIFIIMPILLMFIYFYHSSSQEARVAILRKKIIVEEVGITIKFDPIEVTNLNNHSISNIIQPKDLFYPKKDILSIYNMGSYIKINLKNGRYKFISIPINNVKGNPSCFLAYILQYNKQNID